MPIRSGDEVAALSGILSIRTGTRREVQAPSTQTRRVSKLLLLGIGPDATPGGQNDRSKRIDVNLCELDALLRCV